MFLEVLWQRGEIAGCFPPVGVEVVQASGVRSPTGQEGHSARTTDGLLHSSTHRERERDIQFINTYLLDQHI